MLPLHAQQLLNRVTKLEEELAKRSLPHLASVEDLLQDAQIRKADTSRLKKNIAEEDSGYFSLDSGQGFTAECAGVPRRLELHNRVTKMEEQLAKWRSLPHMASAGNLLQDAQARLDTVTAHAQQLLNRVTKLEEELAKADTERGRSLLRLAAAEGLLQDAQARLDAVTAHAQQLLNRVTKLEEELAKWVSRKKTAVTSHLAAAEGLLQDAQARLDAVTAHAQQLLNRVTKLEEELRLAAGRIRKADTSRLKKNIAEEDSGYFSLDSGQGFTAECAGVPRRLELHNRVTKMEEQLAKWRSLPHMASAGNLLQDAQARLDTVTAHAQQLLNRVTKLEEELAKADTERGRSLLRLAAAEGLLQDAQARLDAVTAHAQQLLNRVTKLEEELAKWVSRKKTAVTSHLAAAEGLLQDAQARLDAVTAHAQQLLNRVTKLEEELAK
ncbi:tropomyosin-like [Ostrinia furnacalis]|uniref:tropomyosin-like n=1 Tax=Ostrinia furnacalis TaxID=93504 RepID=UPI0010405BD5|nr:tropomyosin-like [Ostrinia furnacalis]